MACLESAAMFVHHAQLRFSDTDAMGHVNHARFATLLEDARIALLRSLAGDGVDLPTSGMILARLAIDYVRPLMLDDQPVAVRAWLVRLGASSFVIDYDITQRGEVCARASSMLVAYDYEAARSRPLTDGERRRLSAAVRDGPA
jgi:acyl-CoA thioester hydrolase